MICTVTLNPSLDYHLTPGNIQQGGLHRCSKPYYVAGGKGINVSALLAGLGVPTRTLGFVGGFVGQQLVAMLGEQNIPCDFTQIGQNTRLNVKMDGDVESEFNAPGPVVTQDEWEDLLAKVSALQKGDILVLSGSMCAGLPNDPYAVLAAAAKAAGADFVLDTTLQNMGGALAMGPLFIKPNIGELCEMVGRDLPTLQDVVDACREMIERGAGSVLCTMGGEGACFVDAHTALFCPAPQGAVVNTIGSGDSTVAGLCAKWDSDPTEKCKFAVACGSASAFTAGLATAKQIDDVYKEMN